MIFGYIYNVFLRIFINCLDYVKDKWLRDGVFRVVILRNFVVVSRLFENDIIRINFINFNIIESIYVNISYLGVNVKLNDNLFVENIYGDLFDSVL